MMQDFATAILTSAALAGAAPPVIPLEKKDLSSAGGISPSFFMKSQCK